MPRLDLLCGIAMTFSLFGCSDSTPTAPAVREVRYSGTISNPQSGGTLVYKISGTWKLDEKNALISGIDSVHIIDAKLFGYPGTVTLAFKTDCVGIVGKDAWAQMTVTSTTDSTFEKVGGVGIIRLSNVGGVAKGNGGPKDVWYPTGNLCTDKPTLPLFDLAGGSIVIP